MGFWGIKSYENYLAHDALDAGFYQVHGKRYEELMDYRNPVPYEKVHEELADLQTLEASLAALQELAAELPDDSEDDVKLAYVGVVVRHAECKLTGSEGHFVKAIELLEQEDLDWPRPTERKLRIEKELALLRKHLQN